jgi:hypothetical protein
MTSPRFVTLTVSLVSLGNQMLRAQDVTGTGVKNSIPVWISTSKIGDSVMNQSGSNVGVNTASPAHALDVTGDVNSSAGYMIGGVLVLFANTTISSTATTAVVEGALEHNSTGVANTAAGQNALMTNTTGTDNAAFGFEALQLNSAGNYNTAHGAFALEDATGSNNTTVL